MGTFLKVMGIISLVLGIFLTLTVLGATVGIPLIVEGVVLFALGSVYNEVREISRLIRSSEEAAHGGGTKSSGTDQP